MNNGRFILREIAHRKLNFLLSVVGAAAAVVVVLGMIAALRAHDRQTDAEMAQLEDQIRKSMKGLGFNIYIFPKGQDMSEVYAEGYASKTMPGDYVTRLAESSIVTVNHLLPSLTQKLKWPEQNDRTVILIGVRGEVPIAHKDPKKPLIDPVERGKLVLGYELHQGTGLEAGDTVTFLGDEYTIDKTYPERGSKDDITIWMNLAQAQEILDKPGEINAIQALECNCATVDRLGEIRAELMQILPDTQIIETQSTALARAEARNEAKARRDAQRAEREKLAGILLPSAALFAMIWIGMLTFINVRERVTEIGILRAIGVKGRTILGAFLGRAGLSGVLGALLGIILIVMGMTIFSERWLGGIGWSELLQPVEFAWPFLLAPALAMMAAWLPALAASQRDPADVLRHD